MSAAVSSGLVTDSADARDITLGVVGSASVPRLSVRPTPVSTSGLTFISSPAGEPLNGAKITLTSNNAAGSGTITAGVTGTGELTFHGQTHPVSFTYKAKRTGSDVHVKAKIAELKLAEFGIEKPSFAGVSTGMVAEVKVKFKLRGE